MDKDHLFRPIKFERCQEYYTERYAPVPKHLLSEIVANDENTAVADESKAHRDSKRKQAQDQVCEMKRHCFRV